MHVLIVCAKTTARGYINYREEDKGVLATELHRKLTSRATEDNKRFIPLVEEREMSEQNMGRHSAQDNKANLELTHSQPEPAPELNGQTATLASIESVTTIKEETKPLDCEIFFNEEGNIHLIVVALVIKFIETSTIFTLEEFKTLLSENVNIRFSDMQLLRTLRIFLRRRYIIRVNKEIRDKKARYSLTPDALTYANEEPKPGETLKVKVARKPSTTPPPSSLLEVEVKDEDKKPKPEVLAEVVAPQSDILGGLQTLVSKCGRLKGFSEKYLTANSEISKRKTQLSDLDPSRLMQENEEIELEIAQLEKRIATLRNRKAEIQSLGESIALLQTEINGYTETLRREGLAEKHREYLAAEAELAKIRGILENIAS